MDTAQVKDALANPGKYVLVVKKDLDELLRLDKELAEVNEQCKKSIAWLTKERERLIKENDDLIAASDELIENSKKLMAMHEQALEDNRRLGELLAKFLPPDPDSGPKGSQVN